MSEPLISTGELKRRLDRSEVSVIDATWFLGAKKGRDAYTEGHLPGARFFDVDEVAERDTDLPHMLPPPERFAEAASELLEPGTDIVVYDGSTVRSAARVWWSFRAMGAENVAVLDGGLEAWRRAGLPLRSERPRPGGGQFEVSYRPERVVSRDELKELLADEDVLVLDARSEGRFSGTEPEPRAGLSSGAMRGARNIPFGRLYDGQGKLRSEAELKALFAPFEVERRKRVIATCGSGVTACSILLALRRLGHENLALYDGAWTEWASRGEEIVQAG